MSLVYDLDEGLFTGYAQSIADVDGDFMPDLLLTTKDKSGKLEFHVLTLDSPTNQYKFHERYAPPVDNIQLYGQSQFADFGKTCEISKKTNASEFYLTIRCDL
jgi:hypothetical protein